MQVRTSSVVRDGLTFDVQESGPADGEPVLLLHGFPQHADSWDGVAARLNERGYRTIAPDQRGYSPGARPAGRSAYRIGELAADALAVADQTVGAGVPVHVVGHDWGAVVAWRLAAHQPDRLRTVTAVSVPPAQAFLRALLTSRQALASWYIYTFWLPVVGESALAARGRPFSPLLAMMLRRTGQSEEAAERDAARMADPAAITAALNWYRAMLLERSMTPDPAVRVPTLFVWSDGDTAVTRQSTERVHKYVTGPYRYAELRGVSHWIPDEAPEALASLLLDHLRPPSGPR